MVVKYIRLLILETFHVQNEEEGVPELRLLALENCGDDPDGTLRKILLRDSWIHTPVVACDVVHFIFMHSSTCTSIAAAAEPSVTDDFASLPRLLVDDTCNALIVHPDILASPTRIAESVMCGRMAVLSTRLPSSSSQKHSSAILGTLKHELFERALEYSCSDGLCPEDSMLQEWSQDIVRRNLGGLIAVNLTSKDAINDLRESIPHLTGWLTQFVVEEEFAPAASTSAQNKQQLHPELHIASLVATEEEIWSPVWGLRGFLDATVQVEMHGGSSNEEKRSYILALELKTGSRSDFARIDHRAQVILYSLLLQGMYGPDVSPTMGVLVYINSEMGAETQIVSPSWHEVRALLQARNQHAHDVESASSSVPVTLPPPLQRPQQCSRCFQVRSSAQA
jgi:DNA replication ATP-dependent helicase Dna2